MSSYNTVKTGKDVRNYIAVINKIVEKLNKLKFKNFIFNVNKLNAPKLQFRLLVKM